MTELPPSLLGAYANLARRLHAEERLAALDDQMSCLATIYRTPGAPNYYARKRQELVRAAGSGGAGRPLAEIVKAYLEKKASGRSI